MPTLEFVRHSQHNGLSIRIKGTDRAFMYDSDGLTFETFSKDTALNVAREYAERKGWDIDETIPPKHNP